MTKTTLILLLFVPLLSIGQIQLKVDTLVCSGDSIKATINGQEISTVKFSNNLTWNCDTCLETKAIVDSTIILSVHINKGLSGDTVINQKIRVRDNFKINISGWNDNQFACFGSRPLLVGNINKECETCAIEWVEGILTLSYKDSIKPTIDKNRTFILNIRDTTNNCPAKQDSIHINVSQPVSWEKDLIGCKYQSFQLEADRSGKSYKWNNKLDLNNDSIYDPLWVNPTENKEFICELTDSVGCLYTNKIKVIIQQPEALFTTDKQEIKAFETVIFSNNSIGAGSFIWSFGDGNISTQHSPSNTYQFKGLYTVSMMMTDENGCSDTLVQRNLIKVDTTTGIIKSEIIKELLLYPNPSSLEMVNLKINTNVDIELIIKIIDQSGRIISSENQFVSKSTILPIKTNNLAKGYYTLQLLDRKRSNILGSIKLIKTN